MQKNYSDQVVDIQKNYKEYYEAFKSYVPFNGPSLHFHSRALGLREEVFGKNSDEQKKLFLEMIYATLVSWGMHRMGDRGAKMVDFNVFEKSIIDSWENVSNAQEYTLKNMDDKKWGVVKNIYKKVVIMSGNSHLVGNSKVMAHLLPDIVAPIDREYTISFLNKRKLKRGMKTKIVPNNRNNTITKKNDEEYKQWDVFYNITEGFFHKIAQDGSVQKFYNDKKGSCNWNTSLLKFVDNLVIGAKPKKIKKKIKGK